MLVSFFVAVLLSLDTCSDCSCVGRDVKLCVPHAALERSTLDREGQGMKAKHEAAAIASLEAIAALTQQHSNAPSAKVAETLAAALEHESWSVRQRAAELLGPPQHAEIGLEALVRALADTKQHFSRTAAELRALDTKLAGKLPDKRREVLDAERKACEERKVALAKWRRTLSARLALFPDDRAVDAILASTSRNLVLNSDVALVRLGNKKAVRALQESFDNGDKNIADIEKELANRDAARGNRPKTLGEAMEGLVVARMQEARLLAQNELMAAFAERGLSSPGPGAYTSAWKKWIDQNLGAFPEHLPGVSGAAW